MGEGVWWKWARGCGGSGQGVWWKWARGAAETCLQISPSTLPNAMYQRHVHALYNSTAHLCEMEGPDDHVGQVLLVYQGHSEVSQGHGAAHRLRPVLVALDLGGGALEGEGRWRGRGDREWW